MSVKNRRGPTRYKHQTPKHTPTPAGSCEPPDLVFTLVRYGSLSHEGPVVTAWRDDQEGVDFSDTSLVASVEQAATPPPYAFLADSPVGSGICIVLVRLAWPDHLLLCHNPFGLQADNTGRRKC